MQYQIQDSDGHVHGRFEMPRTDLTVEETTGALTLALDGILGLNSITARRIMDTEKGRLFNRLVIDLEPVHDPSDRIGMVMDAVNALAVEPPTDDPNR